MRQGVKPTIAILALLGACALSADAIAGNMRSNTTPKVWYWYQQVNADHILTWTGGAQATVVIDDITYFGHPTPGDDGSPVPIPCVFEDSCSFFYPDPLTQNGQEDFGALLNVNTMDTSIDFAGSAFTMTVTTTTTRNTGATVVAQTGRRWVHAMEVMEAPPGLQSRTIDKWTLTGHAYVAMRETTESELYAITSEQTNEFGDKDVSGGIGLGIGVGTGLGATAYLEDTSVHRPYQTPWVLSGDQVNVVSTNFANGSVLLRGRIIYEAADQPTRVGSFTVQPNVP